jgi:hypothetical protein
VSQQWGGAGRHGRHGPADRGRGLQPLERAQEARASLQEQFYRVDQFQSDIGGSVKLYAELLPDRAARTGVVPGWSELDRRANELILEYLGLLDRYDPLEEAGAPQLQQATTEFTGLTPKLGYLGNDMEAFLDRFGDELRKVGEAKQAVERRVAAAVAKVDEAEAAWRAMTAEGLAFPTADTAVAQARVAARKLTEIAPRLTAAKVEEPAAVVERLAEDALRLATDLPRRAATLKTRIPSLNTRIDALETRSGSVADAMRALRREFAMGNWRDIADHEDDLEKMISGARIRVRELGRLYDRGDISAALSQLDEVETELTRAAEIVDGPRQRLTMLREIKADPAKLFDGARFTLRDARYLIMRGRTVAPQPWAGRLDAAAAELIAMEDLLTAPHPDYLALKTRMDALVARVKQLIDEVRGRSQ